MTSQATFVDAAFIVASLAAFVIGGVRLVFAGYGRTDYGVTSALPFIGVGGLLGACGFFNVGSLILREMLSIV